MRVYFFAAVFFAAFFTAFFGAAFFTAFFGAAFFGAAFFATVLLGFAALFEAPPDFFATAILILPCY